jgi:hypothetical protein
MNRRYMNHNRANPDTFTQGNASVATTTTVIIPANPVAKYRGITNDGATPIYLAFGIPAEMNKGIRLNANGGAYECSLQEGNMIIAAINGISSATVSVSWMEGV